MKAHEKLIQAQKEYIEFLEEYQGTEKEINKAVRLCKVIEDAEENLKTNNPPFTPEKLGEMFDKELKKLPGVFYEHFNVIDKIAFIRLVSELSSQTRQPETEINLPTTEAVKEWFSGCANDNDLFWTNEYSSKQVLDEIIKALKYFMKPKNE